MSLYLVNRRSRKSQIKYFSSFLNLDWASYKVDQFQK